MGRKETIISFLIIKENFYFDDCLSNNCRVFQDSLYIKRVMNYLLKELL